MLNKHEKIRLRILIITIEMEIFIIVKTIFNGSYNARGISPVIAQSTEGQALASLGRAMGLLRVSSRETTQRTGILSIPHGGRMLRSRSKRVDGNYVVDVVGQLSACPASGKSVYFRNRPVDLVEFLCALCSFDVASHALPPAERSGPRISGQLLGYVVVKNADRQGDDFLNHFAAFVGGIVKMREFTSQVDYAACVESTKKKTHKVIAFDNPFFTSPSAHEDLKIQISCLCSRTVDVVRRKKETTTCCRY